MYHSCPELYFQADSPKGADNIKKYVSKDLFFAEALISSYDTLAVSRIGSDNDNLAPLSPLRALKSQLWSDRRLSKLGQKPPQACSPAAGL